MTIPHSSLGFEVDVDGAPIKQPGNLRELAEYYAQLIDAVDNDNITLDGISESYGKCIEASWRFGYAAMQLIAQELGMTFQQRSSASRSLFEIQRDSERSKREGEHFRLGSRVPKLIIDGQMALFPYTDPYDEVTAFLSQIRSWVEGTARRFLAEADGMPDQVYVEDGQTHRSPVVSDEVRQHWEKLANGHNAVATT